MQSKGGANQSAPSNPDMSATSSALNAELISNLSSDEVVADKATYVNQQAPKAPMSPAQVHGPMTNSGSGNQAGQHHHNYQQQHHHQQPQQQHHQQHHHHHHHQQQHQQQQQHHGDQSNSEPAVFVHHNDVRYGPYQNQHHGPYYHQNRHRHSHKNETESPVNHIILITVINPHYPITCDLIHQICSTYGKVNRIVIFKKNGVQAMVEFDSIEPAKRAKSMLQGCDIYSGCCTLRVEFAKPSKLNVHKNDSDSFDYTNLELGSGTGNQAEHSTQQHSASSHANTYLHNHGRNVGANRRENPKPNIPPTPAGSMGNTQVGTYQSDQTATSNHDPTSGPDYVAVGEFLSTNHCIDHSVPHYNVIDRDDQDPPLPHPQSQQQQQQQQQQQPPLPPPHHHHHHHQQHPQSHSHNQHHRDALLSGGQGTVMMVYGLNPDRINCDRLFNLFCLYGNVVRVKFLRTKEGCAMVQMGDVIAVDRCVSSLNKTTLFGNELQISYSKQPFLHDVVQPFALPDGSPSFKDFMGNKNNRFKNPEVASKNRILPPSKILHFFNAPYGISEDELAQLFKQETECEPMSIKIFTPKAENVKSYSGLVTFRDPAEATEALVLCNHISMPKAGAPHPYILRLCFSPPTYC